MRAEGAWQPGDRAAQSGWFRQSGRISDEAPQIESPERGEPVRLTDEDLKDYPLQDLLDLRAKVESFLPPRTLGDINLAHELVLQVLALQRLQGDVLMDSGTPANQRAQVANALSQALTTLSKLQVDVYTSERLKRIEAVLVDTLNELPQEAQERFLARYEEAVGKV